MKLEGTRALGSQLLAAGSLLNSLNSGMIGLGKSVKNLIIDRLVEDIDLSSSEVASADTLLEQNPQLGKGTAIGLGEAEVGVDDAEEADTTLWNQLVYNL